jgi:polyisoprenoid-binding protein YceI
VPRFAENEAVCSIVAFKDGVLSRAGHDVKLEAGTVVVEIEAGKVVATVDARTVRPVCAMKDGREDRTALSPKDLETIRGYVESDILAAARYPEIRFESSSVVRQGNALAVDGKLTLRGRTRPLRARVERKDDRWLTRISIRQPEFGIRPFTALLGALKIKPDVLVELSIPAVDLDSSP